MSRRGWVFFAAMCVIWGIPYLLIKVAVDELSPAMLVFARTAIAALLLLPIAVARGEPRSRSRFRGCCWGSTSSGSRARSPHC
jgi:drug/metabolite transporter (DMT)-like permease